MSGIKLVAPRHPGLVSAVSAGMAYRHRAWFACQGRLPWPGRWRRAAMLSALLLVPGCETLNRMDYLDQFFEPQAYAARREARLPPVAGPAQPVGLPQEALPPVVPEAAPPAPAIPAPAMRAQAAPESAPPAAPAGETVNRASAAPDGDRNQWVRNTVRQHPWLALNWAQLTTAQQQRVERQLANAGSGRLLANSEPASAWDTMGLDDRTDLAFGAPGTPAMAGAVNRDGGYATQRR